MRLISIVLAACALPFFAGCSSQQLYGVCQGWQENECNKISDLQERKRCQSSARTSYEAYKRDTDEAKSGK